ncbi:hypothetical protein VZT92_012377 [Zoarces viviparus]|uniref:Uncharacterized protein n=1 Tax=Zoarces viviparus TaxID=48416 RepID=A0AAW1F8H2_ZOAVI
MGKAEVSPRSLCPSHRADVPVTFLHIMTGFLPEQLAETCGLTASSQLLAGAVSLFSSSYMSADPGPTILFSPVEYRLPLQFIYSRFVF